MLSVSHALLNDTLHLPPFSLLLVALMLTDGIVTSHFPTLLTPLMLLYAFPNDRDDAQLLLSGAGYRIMAGNWPVHQLLLYNIVIAPLVRRYLCGRGISDVGCFGYSTSPQNSLIILARIDLS